MKKSGQFMEFQIFYRKKVENKVGEVQKNGHFSGQKKCPFLETCDRLL